MIGLTFILSQMVINKVGQILFRWGIPTTLQY